MDLQSLYRPAKTEYDKLPFLYQALWTCFPEASAHDDDATLIEALLPKMTQKSKRWSDLRCKQRQSFYQAVTAFQKCLYAALLAPSYHADAELGLLIDGEKITYREHYQATLLRVLSMKRQVQTIASDPIHESYTEEHQ